MTRGRERATSTLPPVTAHATGTATGTRAKPTPSARRDEILAIAAAIFARKGILGTTVRDIADEAGILSGSLYHHFESKDQMVEEILYDHGQRQLQAFKEVVAREPDPVEAVHGLVIVGVQLVADNPDVARIFRNDVQQIKEMPRLAHVERNRQDSRQIWNGVVQMGIDRGVFQARLDPEIVVRAMFDGVLASFRWFPPLGRSTPSRISEQLSRLYVDGLR
jgi:AcrR family transcriptional regulator